MPGALKPRTAASRTTLETQVTATLEQAIERLNQMRDEEGRSASRELRERMDHLSQATHEVEQLRGRGTEGLSGESRRRACRS